jgi:hypothetical protein
MEVLTVIQPPPALTALLLAAIVPMWRLVDRAGLHPLWSLLAVAPLGLVALLWIVAFRRDPGEVA